MKVSAYGAGDAALSGLSDSHPAARSSARLA